MFTCYFQFSVTPQKLKIKTELRDINYIFIIKKKSCKICQNNIHVHVCNENVVYCLILIKKNYGQWNVHDHTPDGWWAKQMLCSNVSLEKKSNFANVLRRCYLILNTEKNTYVESEFFFYKIWKYTENIIQKQMISCHFFFSELVLQKHKLLKKKNKKSSFQIMFRFYNNKQY